MMKILTVTKEEALADEIHLVLTSIREDAQVERCANLDDLRRLSRNTPGHSHDAILVDIDPDQEAVLNDLKPIIKTNSQSHFIVVSNAFNQDLLPRAMHAGVWHFIHKKQLAAELCITVAKLLFNRMHQGRIISVLSCSGGCGATTIASNLASELALSSDAPSILVDLDLTYGGVSRCLGLNGSYGIDHVLAREGVIDRDLIESIAVPAGERVSVLLSPAGTTTENESEYTFDRLVETLTACKESYGHVVIDAPRVSPTVLKTLSTVSDVMVVAFQMRIGDLRFAASLIRRLTEYGLAPERILPVANRVGRRSVSVDIGHARRLLQPTVLHCLRNDWSRAVKSLNRAQTLSATAKRSGLRRDFQKLLPRIEILPFYVPRLNGVAWSPKADPVPVGV
jgi:pilus assembly protein CpaE